VAESLGAAVLTVSVDDRQFQAGLNAARSKADQAAGQITQSFGGITNSLRQLASVAGIVGIGALTQQLIATGQESQRAQIQLKALAGGYSEAAAAGQAAARIQQVLGISAVDATQGFAQLYAALRGTGIGLKQLEVLFVGISNAARLSGAGTQEAQAALLQLKQGLAAGVLQGDELRSVLEQLPAFAQAIAGQLNVNVGQLRKLGSEGKITSDIVFNAAKQLATAAVPGRTEVEQLGIAFENVKAQAAAALGPPLLGVLQATAAGLVAFKKFLEENQQALIGVGRSVIEIGRTLAPFVAGILAVQAAMKAWSIASKAVATAQAAVLALQGPKGWAILTGAIAASAGAAIVLEKTLKNVGTATKEVKAEAQAAFEQFKQLLNNTSLPGAADPTETSFSGFSLPQPPTPQFPSAPSNPSPEQALQRAESAGQELAQQAEERQRESAERVANAFKRVESASDALAQAQSSLRSALEGSFDLLTTGRQESLLRAAQADLNAAVRAGFFDQSKVNKLSGKELLSAAGQARGVLQADDNLLKANIELISSNVALASVTKNLANKDWTVNVAVNASTGDSAVQLG
jgi:tape measure domain-containing protein